MARTSGSLAEYVRQSTAEHLTHNELAQAARAAGFEGATAKRISNYRHRDAKRAATKAKYPKLQLVRGGKPKAAKPATATIPVEQEWFRLVARIGTDRALEIVERVRARADHL